MAKKRYIVGITGASGPEIGLKLAGALLEKGFEVHLAVSGQAKNIIRDETGLDIGNTKKEAINALARYFGNRERLFYSESTELWAPVASGSFKTEGMFVAPCSMKSLSALACGYAANLIERAADVCIKEGRKLVICPREMPFSPIHLENMLKLAKIGVIIAPPVAAFYPGPRTIDEMTGFFVGKLLDSAGIDHDLYRRWDGQYDAGHGKRAPKKRKL
ncbi:MAG: UbiX family flavin prenyltransferase [Nitrospiraceae bacterium]|nr:UbiX family flavin prenyltransferase [Nitrospiraceae bacterium]